MEPAAISARPASTTRCVFGERTRKAGGEGEGHGEAVGKTDDEVAHEVSVEAKCCS